MAADGSKESRILPISMPATGQVLTRYVVFALPLPHLTHEFLPSVVLQAQFLPQSSPLLPDELEQQLPHVFSHVLRLLLSCLSHRMHRICLLLKVTVGFFVLRFRGKIMWVKRWGIALSLQFLCGLRLFEDFSRFLLLVVKEGMVFSVLLWRKVVIAVRGTATESEERQRTALCFVEFKRAKKLVIVGRGLLAYNTHRNNMVRWPLYYQNWVLNLNYY